MVAASSTAGVILLILGGALVLTAGAALYLRGRSKEQAPDIPEAMRPGPADAALETPLLQKLQGWGVVLVAFLVVWMPYTWLREPSENLKQEEDLKAAAISRGERAVHLFSEENQLGVGCVRCHGPELRGGVIQVGADYDVSAEPHQPVCRAVRQPPAQRDLLDRGHLPGDPRRQERDALVEHPVPRRTR